MLASASRNIVDMKRREHSMSGNKAVTVGTKFHSAYADSSPLWRVVRERGGDTWDCVVDAENPDWAGTKKVFGGEEIRRSIAASAFWDSLADRSADFWGNLKEGQTVHYHNAFGQYIRGVAVRGESHGRPAMVMRPTALVGAWREYDLPRWSDAGFSSQGCHSVRMIASGETMQPNSGSMWESPEFSRPLGDAARIDPTALDPIDLSLPEPTPEQAEAARLLAIVEALRVAVSHKDGQRVADFSEEYRNRIMEAARILSTAQLTLDEDGPALKF